MTENRNYLQKYAMHFGTYMGIYWTLKFILFPLGFAIPFLFFVVTILTLSVPYIGFSYAKMYRQKACGGTIGLSHAMMFCLFMYMFASLFVAVAHYIYFQFIDNGYILNSYVLFLDEVISKTPELVGNKEMIKDAINSVRSLNAINITMQLLSWNVFCGAILSIPTALLVMKKAKPNSDASQS